jgi:hypothetical protein
MKKVHCCSNINKINKCIDTFIHNKILIKTNKRIDYLNKEYEQQYSFLSYYLGKYYQSVNDTNNMLYYLNLGYNNNHKECSIELLHYYKSIKNKTKNEYEIIKDIAEKCVIYNKEYYIDIAYYYSYIDNEEKMIEYLELVSNEDNNNNNNNNNNKIKVLCIYVQYYSKKNNNDKFKYYCNLLIHKYKCEDGYKLLGYYFIIHEENYRKGLKLILQLNLLKHSFIINNIIEFIFSKLSTNQILENTYVINFMITLIQKKIDISSKNFNKILKRYHSLKPFIHIGSNIDICPISGENNISFQTNCNHLFSNSILFIHNDLCPCCRQPIFN